MLYNDICVQKGTALGESLALELGLNNKICARNYSIRQRSGLERLSKNTQRTGREREMFYLTTHSTHFIYGYMASDIWLRTILIVRKETRYRHIGYSYRLTARVLLYAPSHRQDNTYHGLCYTSRGELAGTRNSPKNWDCVLQKRYLNDFKYFFLY